MSDPFSDFGTGASQVRIDSADYELLWPRALLIRELTALRHVHSVSERYAMVERLLEETFLGDAPLEDYRGSASRPGISISAQRRYDYIAELLDAAPRLREHRQPAPYWSTRHNPDGHAPLPGGNRTTHGETTRKPHPAGCAPGAVLSDPVSNGVRHCSRFAPPTEQ